MGRIAADGGPGAATFREVWNGERFRLARRFFGRRDATLDEQRHICWSCPAKIDHERFLEVVQLGGTREQWRPRFNSNDRYNYFWNRRLVHRATPQPTVPATRPGDVPEIPTHRDV